MISMSVMKLILCLLLYTLSVCCYATPHRSILLEVSDSDQSGGDRDYDVELNATSFEGYFFYFRYC